MIKDTLLYSVIKAGSSCLTFIILPIINTRFSDHEIALLGFYWILGPLAFRLSSLGSDVGLSVHFYKLPEIIERLKQKIISIIIFVALSSFIGLLYLLINSNNFLISNTSLPNKIGFIIWIVGTGISNLNGNYYILTRNIKRFFIVTTLPNALGICLVLIFPEINTLWEYFIVIGLVHIFLQYKEIFELKNVLSNISYKDLNLQLELIRSGIPSIPGSILVSIMVGFDRFILERFVNTSTLAAYSLVYKIADSSVLTISNSFNKAFYPILAKRASEIHDKDESKKVSVLADILVLIGVNILILISPLLIWLFRIFFSDKSTIDNIELVLLLTMFNSILVSGVSILGNYFTVENKLNITLKITLYSVIINIILNLIFIPGYGILGAIISTIVSYFFLYVYLFKRIKKNQFQVISVINLILLFWIIILQDKLGIISFLMCLPSILVIRYSIKEVWSFFKEENES